MTPAELLNLVAGALLACLGVAVLVLRGRHRPAAVFGCFALALSGLVLGLSGSISAAFPAPPPAVRLVALAFFIGTIALVIFTFPTRLRRDEAGLLAIALAAGLVHGAARVLAILADDPAYFALDGHGVAEWAGHILLQFSNAFFPAAIILPGLRARSLAADAGRQARSLAFLGTGLALFVAGNARFLVDAAGPSGTLAGALIAPTVFLPATLAWVFAAGGAHAVLARRVAVAHAGIFVAAIIVAAFESNLAYPVGRLVGALFLGYAVLGGQIEGLDVKLRFAISKSTIAAIFIAVFFIASEAAQQVFGARFGPVYGIAAAGSLVFTMAPLQRIGERLAQKAVPIADESVPAIHARSRPGADTYRRAVRLALKDRKLTTDEEVELAHVAHDLGLSAPDATRIRHEVEDALRSSRGRRGEGVA